MHIPAVPVTLRHFLLAFALLAAAAVTVHAHPLAHAQPRSTNSTKSGCGSPTAWKFDSGNHANRTLYSGARSFLVHIPPSYNDSVAHPLVFSFHGFKGHDSDQERISGFSADGLTINNYGIIAVYPNGAIGPGKGGAEPVLERRAWQGAPYAKVSRVYDYGLLP